MSTLQSKKQTLTSISSIHQKKSMLMNGRINCANANRISIVEFLAKNGYQPKKNKGNNYWYNSPLRNENKPSFKVNKALNAWFDYGLWKGGNLVDLGIRMYNCSVKEFLEMINTNTYSPLQPSLKKVDVKNKNQDNSKIEVIKEIPISNQNLINYLDERKIPLNIAKRYLKEVYYIVKEREYYALGFKNDSGGYELRNKHYKLSSAPKNITTIINGNETLAVFEGFFDFLTIFQTKLLPVDSCDFLILNSVAFKESIKKYTHSYDKVFLFLDNDNGGNLATEMAIKLVPQKAVDMRPHYAKYNDLNKWWMNYEKEYQQHQEKIIRQANNRNQQMGM